MGFISSIRSTVSQTFWSSGEAQPFNSPAGQLKEAISEGNLNKVQSLLSSYSYLKNVFFEGKVMPLHAAVRLGKVEIARYLVSIGCDLSAKDGQRRSALDYALVKKDLEMVRALMPSPFVKELDLAQKELQSFQFADPKKSSQLSQYILGLKKSYDAFFMKSIMEGSSAPRTLSEAIAMGESERAIRQRLQDGAVAGSKDLIAALLGGGRSKIDLMIVYSDDKSFNYCDEQGISPMHVAAALNDIKSLGRMVAGKGSLLKKNANGISPVDLLFLHAKSDPVQIPKAQLLLGLLSLGNIVASTYIRSTCHHEEEQSACKAAELWSGGLMLLSVGADLALSYHAYLQLSPKDVWQKVAYWATAMGSVPLFALIHEIPGAKIVWDIWRTKAVCGRAFEQMKIAYHNFPYGRLRAAEAVGVQLLTVGTTLYHTKESFEKVLSAPGRVHQYFEEQRHM